MTTETTTPTFRIFPREKADNLLTMYANLEAEKLRLRTEIKELDEALDEVKIQLQSWADENQAEFEGKKTLALDGGTIGFKKEGERLVWSLEQTPDDHEAKLLKTVQTMYPEAIEASVNKGLLLKAWCVLPNLRKQLGKLGLTTRNDDKFYVSVKK